MCSKDQLEEQNLHSNKPIVKALALRIHQEKLESVGPVTRSHGQAASTAQFNASDGWVQREKRKLGMNDHKPVVKKKYKREKGDDPELRRDRAAIFWDEVEEVVKTYGVNGPSTQTKSVPRSSRPPAPYGIGRVDLLPSSPRTTRARRPSPSSLRRLREATSSNLAFLLRGKLTPH